MKPILVSDDLYAEIRAIAKKHKMTHSAVIASLLEIATKAAKEGLAEEVKPLSVVIHDA